MNKIQKIEIKINQSKEMLFSEWLLFGLSALIVIVFMKSMLDIITSLGQTEQLLAMIVFMMVAMKLMSWIRIPMTYRADDVVQSIDWVMEERKK